MNAEIAAIGGADKINFTAFNSIGSTTVVSSSYGVYAITAGSTTIGILLSTHQDFFVTDQNILYTGTVTTGSTQYINSETGLIWEQAKVLHSDSFYYTGAVYVAGQSIKLLPVVYYTDSSGNQIHKKSQIVRQILFDGTYIFMRYEKTIVMSTNGTSFSDYLKITGSKDLQYISPKTTDGSNNELHIALSQGLYKQTVGSIPAEAHKAINVWGSTPFYVPLNTTNYYLSIPSLVGAVTNTQLFEGVDYEIYDFNKLRFLKALTNHGDGSTSSGIGLTHNGEPYYFISGIYLNPMIPSIYFPAFGEENPKVILDSRTLNPYVSGYNSITNFHDKQKAWAKHIAQFTWAAANALRAQPTMQNFERGYSIMRGLPFSYTNAYYDSHWTEGTTNYLKTLVSGTTDKYFTYEIESPAQFKDYSANDFIPRHNVIVSGIKFYDYITDEDVITTLSKRKATGNTTISGMNAGHYHQYEIDEQGNGVAIAVGSGVNMPSDQTTLNHFHYVNNSVVGPANGISGRHIHNLPILNPEEKFHILGVNETNRISGLSYSQNMLNNYLTNSTPAIYFKKSFNRAPSVFTDSDKKYYVSSDTPLLKSLTSDPENDILYYRWTFKGPYANSDGRLIQPEISGLTLQDTYSTLTQPLVDTKFRYDVSVSDDFNSVSRPLDIYVSGQHQFDSWGDTEFKIEDLSSIDFETQTEMNT